MMNGRNPTLTLVCFGLLSTAAMGMPAANMSDMGGNPATPTGPMKQSAPGMSSARDASIGSIKGEILKMQGDLYTVKDATGKEVQLHVDESTQTSDTLKKGDEIEAEITAEGHALQVEKTDMLQ